MKRQKTKDEARKITNKTDFLHRRIATMMIDIQDELTLYQREIDESGSLEQARLIKLLTLETKACLEEFANQLP
jgi:hypothetical protein